MTAADASATLTADCIDLIDENDAGRIFLGLLKQVSDTGGTDTDEHFDEVRTTDAEESNAGFTSNSLSQQGFTSTGRAVKQDAFWDLGA